MRVSHLVDSRFKTILGIWPHRKKKPILIGIRVVKAADRNLALSIANRQGETLVEVRAHGFFDVGYVDIFLTPPVTLMRVWWPLRGKAIPGADIQLLLAVSKTKYK